MKIVKCLQFAAEKHKGQERRCSGLPYIIHPITVMHLLEKYKVSKNIEDLKCAAILHDTLEDTPCSYIEIETEFGPLVASVVMELTSDEEAIKKIGKNEYLKEKMLNMSKYALTLKLVDRLANVLDAPKPNYLKDTLSLMAYITDNRYDITDTQKNIIRDIVFESVKKMDNYSIVNKI